MKAILVFRIVAIVEALSYIGLLAYAMPMKYIYDNPVPVKILGAAHGGLFVLFCIALLIAMIIAKWSLKTAIMLFIASIVPFGSFFFDPFLKREQRKMLK